jgi:hypothetical protein
MPAPAPVPKAVAQALRVRDGFALPDDVLTYLARTAIDALSAQGTAYRNACRNLSELTRLVGEVLRRARARSRRAAQPQGPGPLPTAPCERGAP